MHRKIRFCSCSPCFRAELKSQIPGLLFSWHGTAQHTFLSPHSSEKGTFLPCPVPAGFRQRKTGKTNNIVNKTGAGKHAHVVESQSRTSSLSNQAMETPCHPILWRILSFRTTENSPLCFSFCELSWRTVLHQKKKPTALSSTSLGYEI